jgi:hypothetical protein
MSFLIMTKIQKKRLFRISGLTIGAVIFIFAIYFLCSYIGIHYTCPVLAITGLNCPGCGNTRAVLSILNFNIIESFTYNYIYPVEFFYILWVYFFSAKNYVLNEDFRYKAPLRYFDVVALIIVMMWFPIRNFLGI